MKFKCGFSLLELILVIAIFSLSSFALASMLIDANLSTKLSTEQTEALFYAKEGIEAVRAIRDNDWASLTDGDHGLEINSTWVFHDNFDLIDNKYTRTVSIITVDDSTKNISVNVVWALTSSRMSNITLNTILTNWK